MEENTIPNTNGLIDDSPPEHVRYLLPERASCKDADALVLVMDYIENHLSRCRFQLFLEQVVEAWPDRVDSLAIYMVDDDSFGNGHSFAWKGYALGPRDALGNSPTKNAEVPEFWDVLHNAAYPEDPGFVLLVREHFGPKHCLKAINRDKALTLIDEVIPAHGRAKLERQRLDERVKPAPTGSQARHRI